MTAKIVKLDVTSTKEALNRFASALGRARKGKEVDHTGISFESIEGLRNALTRKRLEVLSAVRHKKPNSIYELSKILHRDIKSVNTDLKVLKKTISYISKE